MTGPTQIGGQCENVERGVGVGEEGRGVGYWKREVEALIIFSGQVCFAKFSLSCHWFKNAIHSSFSSFLNWFIAV